MRKIILITICFILLAQISYAHPPEAMDTTYYPHTERIESTITHPVDDPESHFIQKIRILLNDEEILEDTFIRQDNKDSHTVSYAINVEVRSGDKITVEAYCNKDGMAKQEIEIE